MKTVLFMLIPLLLIASIASAQENFTEAKQLINSGISCNKLTDEQLEAIGDYYMEQMHPGQSHEIMDKMMGGEGSSSLKQMHINMAKTLYCGELNQGMMGIGMMGGVGMMNMMQGIGGNMMWGVSGWNTFGWINQILITVILILLIIFLYKKVTKK